MSQAEDLKTAHPAPKWFRVVNLILAFLVALNVPSFLLSMAMLAIVLMGGQSFSITAFSPMALYLPIFCLFIGLILGAFTIILARRRWARKPLKQHLLILVVLIVLAVVTSIQPFIYAEF